MTVPTPPPSSPVWNDPRLCTYSTCPLDLFGQLHYIPSLAGNAFLLTLFVLGLLVQVALAVRYRTWGYLTAMIGGTALEIIGYAGRLMLNANDFNNNNFVIYLVGCTIGPAFFSAAIYLSLSRIIVIFGRSNTPKLNPRLITTIFITSDLLSLILQAAGGALASVANTKPQKDTGINIMIAGLSTQVASTTFFCCLGIYLVYVYRRSPQTLEQSTYLLRHSKKFKFFLVAISVSSLLILERCAYRVAELSGGFDGATANNQAGFMVLDGAAMVVVVALLTVAHPGLSMGRDLWEAGAFKALKKGGRGKRMQGEKFEDS